MLSGKSQASTAPTAMGSLLQASTYGATIPKIYGMTQTALLAIWAANLRQGGSVKKFKQLKKGITAYVENIDFLLGANPIIGVNQMWNNGATIPLEVTSAIVGSGDPYLSGSLPTQILVTGGVPDPNFYSVIGCTFLVPFNYTFDDYGGTGPVTINETFEVPLWNTLQKGPDPNNCGVNRYWPLVYAWEPSMGPNIALGTNNSWWFGPGPFLKVYFTRVTAATSDQGPLTHNRLSFEPQLGDGTEYSDAGLSSQQIIYPMFAGIGSSDIDLGSSGALPSLTAEVQGAFSFYPTGDADFADMIEDIVKSGIAQAALGAGTSADGHTAVETGLSSYNLPGVIQQVSSCDGQTFTEGPLTYPVNITKGNFLVVYAVSGTPGISDSLGNSWTPVFSGTPSEQIWYAQANATGTCTVTVSGTSTAWQLVLLEVAGVDTFDTVSIGNDAGGANITTTTNPNLPGYVLNISANFNGPPLDPQLPSWNTVLSNTNFYYPFPASASSSLDAASMDTHAIILDKRIYSAGTYSVQYNTSINSFLPTVNAMLAFKCTNAPTYPKPVGNFMDPYSLNLVRQQCRANSLYGSLAMNSQQSASDWLKTLYDAADAAPVAMGFQLYSFPLSEVSAIGAGAIYVAPTASGPIANLSTENGDFLAQNDDAPIKVQTAARVDQPNVLQMQCINRTSNYNPSVVEQPDAASISLFGVRKADPITNNAVQDVAIARQLLGIQVRKLQYGGDSYTFTLPAKWCLLAPMDLITISDPLASMFDIPVRLTSITEQEDQSLECEAEPFVYGMYAPTVYGSATTVPAPYQGNPNQPVGSGVNPPIIFEATPRLAQQASPAQIWLVVSCPSSDYGGCLPYISTDGGASYTPVSQNGIQGTAQQGNLNQDWPAASDPDTTNNLFIGFADTLPTGNDLPSYTATQRDNFQYPAYVGYNNEANAQANFTAGDATQITELGILFSNPTLLTALPSDAVISNIFPMVWLEAGPHGSSIVSQIFAGTGLTPTTGGSSIEGPITGDISAPVPTGGGAGIGTSLTNQEIRCNWTLSTTGAPAATGGVLNAGWAIYYSSATPNIDPLTLLPFTPAPGFGFGWAIPKTSATGKVGTGTNATITGNGGIPPAGVPYEIISYNKTTMIDSDDWEVDATGSGNEIRRGVYAAPSPGVGMDHPQGSPFALLDPGGTGLAKVNMDPSWIGVQLWFKFLTFNTFGSVLQPLSDAAAYPYTPTGIPGNTGPATGGILVNGT